MALLYFSGFSEIDSLDKGGWTSLGNPLSISASGRRGGSAVTQFGTLYGAYRPLGVNASTVILGAAYMRLGAHTNVQGLLGFSDGVPAAGTSQMSVRVNANGTLAVYRGATLLGTSTFALPIGPGLYTYLEFKVVFHATNGSYELRAGTIPILSDSGIPTIQTANAYATHFHIGQPTGVGASTSTGINGYWDDLYVCDGTGADRNNFLGDCRVDGVAPSGAGTYTQFTPSVGSNWSNVDEAALSTADYNYSSTPGHKDAYALANLPSLPYEGVLGVRTMVNVSSDVEGSRTAAHLMISGSTEVEGTPEPVYTVNKYLYGFYVQNPDTSADWTQTEVNALQLGATVKT